MRDLGTPLAPTFGGGEKKKEKSEKVLYKSKVAMDEGRMNKEYRLRKRAASLEDKSIKKDLGKKEYKKNKI
jgi:hypothetical protein